MAITDPYATLAYHRSRIFTAHRDVSELPLKKFTEALSKWVDADKSKGTLPEGEALWFYGMNHGMALISSRYDNQEPMGSDDMDFVESYHSIMANKTLRALYYLGLITTREARHNKSLSKLTASEPVKLFGTETCQWFKLTNNESSIHELLLKNPPNTTVGNFFACVEWQFRNCTWNGGYGGVRWADITLCLNRFIRGEFTPEMMMDTIWTLCHNNGPIFNKGHCFGHYSNSIYRVLDVQRSGQVPEAILHDSPLSAFVEPKLGKFMSDLNTRFPDTFRPYVDWYVVEALGSVHKYPHEKVDQAKIHGMSKDASEAEKAAVALAIEKAKKAEEQKEKAKQKAEKEAAHKAAHCFEVMPGVYLDKTEIKRVA